MRTLIIPAVLLLLTLPAAAQTAGARATAVAPSAQASRAQAVHASAQAPHAQSMHVSAQTSGALSYPASAQSVHTLSLADLKSDLVRDGRGISGATWTELERLAPSSGGLTANLWNDEYVFRIGESTFIVDMRLLTGVTVFSLTVILILFSPLGFLLFRGGAHALIGGFLQGFRIAPEFGEHLRREPKKWLQKESSARLAFRSYMRRSFIPDYRNNVTAAAFLGTAFLILVIGLRGIKFLVPQHPDLVIAAIIVEITVLCMLGLTTWYERSDELQSAEAVETVRLPNGEYIDKEYVLQALRSVVEDLNSSVAPERGGGS